MKKALILVALAVFAALPAFGSPVTCGLASPVGTISGGPLNGDTLVTSTSGTFTISGSGGATASGCWTEGVYSDGTDLDFVYQFQVLTASTAPTDGIGEFTADGFFGFSPAAGNYGSGAAPDVPGGQIAGGTAEWFFSDQPGGFVQPPNSSDFLYVTTNATQYGGNTINFIDGGTQQVSALGPAVPEPASMVLFGSGLLSLAGVLRRKLGK